MPRLRPVAPDDLDLVCRHRYEMFKASGRGDEILVPMTEHFRVWLCRHLADESYFGWIVEEDGRPVAGLGMMAIDWPPHPSHPTQDKRGYVLNVFVEPEWRGKGLARELMRTATDEARRRGLRHLVLHATRQGRPLYDKLGWAQTSEMAITLD